MELVTFTEGVQSVRIQNKYQGQTNAPSARAFVPKGESVVQHTERLFERPASNEAELESLMALDNAIGMDPTDYDKMVDQVSAILTNLQKQSGEALTLYEQKNLAAAHSVLNALNEDRKLLQTNLMALEKV